MVRISNPGTPGNLEALNARVNVGLEMWRMCVFDLKNSPSPNASNLLILPMILRVTKKLAGRLKINSLTDFNGKVHELEEWYGHLFYCNKVPYILLTNAHSLFSTIIPGKGITDIKKLSESLGKEYDIYKTSNRAVVGSMNDMISHTKFYLTNYKMSLSEISNQLNQMPFSYLKYKSPSEMI